MTRAQEESGFTVDQINTKGAKGFLDNVVKGNYETENVKSWTPAELVGSLVFVLISLLGVFFILVLIYAGYLWMSAGGNDDQVGKARGLMINAAIGLLIVLSAYFIARFVMDKVAQETRTDEAGLYPVQNDE